MFSILGVLGAIAGSFLSVVVTRFGTGETMVWGRSHCRSCNRPLTAFELIPVFSYLFQRGRCRACKTPIGVFYLLLEVTTIILFLGFGLFVTYAPLDPIFGISAAGNWLLFTTLLFYYLLLAGFFSLIIFYDALFELIPVFPTYLLAAIGVLGHASAHFFGYEALSVAYFLTAGGAFLFFWLLWRLSAGRAMGRGDADLALALALALGPVISLFGLLFSFWLGAIWGILLLGAGRARWKTRVPFGPFLILGSILALFFFDSIQSLSFLIYGFSF
jgi:leader peptidase (prepilin peptidase)/N-methyltransferase